MERDPRVWLGDADRAASDIADFINDMEHNDYIKNRLIQAAVERKFGIIGEALNNLKKTNPEIESRIPDIRKVINFRNFLVHNYGSVLPELVWDYTQNNLPELQKVIRDLLDELGPPTQ